MFSQVKVSPEIIELQAEVVHKFSAQTVDTQQLAMYVGGREPVAMARETMRDLQALRAGMLGCHLVPPLIRIDSRVLHSTIGSGSDPGPAVASPPVGGRPSGGGQPSSEYARLTPSASGTLDLSVSDKLEWWSQTAEVLTRLMQVSGSEPVAMAKETMHNLAQIQIAMGHPPCLFVGCAPPGLVQVESGVLHSALGKSSPPGLSPAGPPVAETPQGGGPSAAPGSGPTERSWGATTGSQLRLNGQLGQARLHAKTTLLLKAPLVDVRTKAMYVSGRQPVAMAIETMVNLMILKTSMMACPTCPFCVAAGGSINLIPLASETLLSTLGVGRPSPDAGAARPQAWETQ